jgi:hypothetical protein
MPEIYPRMTRKKLQTSARKTAQGKGRAPLPGVKTDAKHLQATDKCGYQANRELANLIKTAVRAKKADKHGTNEVGWRLYPNEEHPAWKDKGEHSRLRPVAAHDRCRRSDERNTRR